jgi:hypothetical protein
MNASGSSASSCLRCWPLLVALLIFGCFGDEPRTVQPTPTPAVFVPELFTDISLPKGYMFTPGEDQLAVSMANGAVRRFEVALEQRPSAVSQNPSDLLSEMANDLHKRGWELQESRGLKQQWRKEQERLLLETGRSGGRTTIRLSLRPLQAVGPAVAP